MQDLIADWADRIRAAAARAMPLRIRGGGTKDFYGNAATGALFDTTAFAGIVQYEPTELVLTARCGTPLGEIEATLAGRDQMLAFEPPHFGAGATLGGCVAAGLSGPRRMAAGAVRDFVLGVRILDGRGQDLAFGGRVMKNVAGYDVSRLVAGSLGTLGVILEVSLKVLPRPPRELTLALEIGRKDAIRTVNAWASRPYPITATCHDGERLLVRLSGAAAGVKAAHARIGGEPVEDDHALWHAIREQRLPFFAGEMPLWRLAVRSTAADLDLFGPQLIEWNGALRWLRSDAAAARIRASARAAGGHATLFRAADKSAGAFQPLASPLATLQERLRRTFDPAGVLNPGRMYAG